MRWDFAGDRADGNVKYFLFDQAELTTPNQRGNHHGPAYMVICKNGITTVRQVLIGTRGCFLES